MFKSPFPFLLAFLCFYSVQGQKVPFHGAYPFGSGVGYNDEVKDAYYQGRHIYTTGYFSGSVDFAPGKDISVYSTGSERQDVYFAKYDTLDNLIWAKRLIGVANNEGLGITADSDGNVLVCGQYDTQIDLDPSQKSYVIKADSAGKFGKDAFLAKYDSLGNFLWGFGFGGRWTDAAVDIATDANKNCILTGYFRDTIDIDPGSGKKLLNAAYSKEIFLIQYNSAGKLNWGFSMGSASDDEGKSLHIDQKGHIYLGGLFTNTVDFDPSSASSNIKSTGRSDVFVAKYTNKAALIWAKAFGGRDVESIGSIASNNGKLYVCGDFEGMCDFDPSSNTTYGTIRGYRDLYINCFDTSGSFKWVNTFGANTHYTYGHGVAADSSGNAYIIAFSNAYVDWDPSKKKYDLKGRDDVILASYNDQGNFRWAHKLGGVKVDKANTVIDAKSSIACYGKFDTKAQFDPSNKAPNLLSSGSIISSLSRSGFHARYTKSKGAYLKAFANEDDMGNGDAVYAVTNDDAGNTYVGGGFSGKVDLDQKWGSTHYLDGGGTGKILLAQYDSSMTLKYALDLVCTGSAAINDLVADDSQNVFFTGIFTDTLYLSSSFAGKKFVSKGLNDAIFGKLDAKGKLLWIKQIEGSSRIYGQSIGLDSKGNIIVSGGFASSADFDPSSSTTSKTSSGSYDAFIAKYSNSGTFDWVVNVGNSDNDYCHDIAIGPNDEILATGMFQSSCNFNPRGSNVRRTSWGGKDIFICKYDSKGHVKWVRTHGNSQLDIGFGVEVDNNGNVYATGSFSGKTDFDFSGKTQNLTPSGHSDVFLLSLNSKGDYRWAHKYGSKSTRSGEEGRSIEYRNGRIYLAGHFNDTADFDPSTKKYWLYNPNVFLAIMDTSGIFEEAHSFGSTPQPEAVFDISFSRNGLYLGGLYQDDTDFDPSNSQEHVLVNRRNSDGYLLRLNVPVSCHHSFNTLTISQCGPYTLPSSERTVFEDGTYYDVIRNKEGCDSNLTIVFNRLNDHVSNNISSCGPYKSPAGNTYTQTGTYYDTLSNQFSCDSVIITHLQINSTLETVQAVHCEKYYLPGNQQWVTQSGIYVDSFKNQLGCDSLIEIDLTINQPHYNESKVNACEQFIIPSNQQVVKQSGIYRDSFKTNKGCDSVLAWNVIIHQPSQQTVRQSACKQFYLPGQQQYVQQSGLYNDTLLGTYGCDSVITWDVEIGQPSHDTVQKTICDSFYLTGRNIWVSTPGIHNDNFTSVHGCDSTISWDIDKTQLHAGFQAFGDSLVADSTGYGNYQWFSCGKDTTLIQGADTFYFVPAKSGSYGLAVSQGACFEHSVCKYVTVVSISKGSLEQIRLYPNPTTGIVQIEILKDHARFNGSLYSANGKKLMDFGVLNTGGNQIDISAVPTGSYILVMEGEDGETVRELLLKE